MVSGFGSMDFYSDAELDYRRERIQRDFAAINWAAQERADRRARVAQSGAAGRSAPAPTSVPARRIGWIGWIARWHRTLRPATH